MTSEPTLTIPISSDRLTTTALGITTLRITTTELRTLLQLAEDATNGTKETGSDPEA